MTTKAATPPVYEDGELAPRWLRLARAVWPGAVFTLLPPGPPVPGGVRWVLGGGGNPRISVTVFDAADPYHSVEIRGTAELAGDTGRSLQKAVSHKYLGEDSPPEPPKWSVWPSG